MESPQAEIHDRRVRQIRRLGPLRQRRSHYETALTRAPTRVRVSLGVSQGLLVTKVQPIYPEKALKKHIQGPVLMKAIISREGDVKELTLISGHPLLAPAAEDAVKRWKYRPYLLNSKPVEVETQIQVNFSLTR